ncbi:uncharacterized protein V2V93DRAFT_320135 [Kockiozyma suomiensis]|uniref:uncharacterized protein n=1 Tax=Kockiozyma suomiensis TaxID=1337062 RepID=UPI0033441A86
MPDEIDTLLSRESATLSRDREIDRILHCFQLDSYSILDLLPGCTTSDIRAQYRRKSLLIHPDKTTNPNAPDAFNRLKRAEAELTDDAKRALLDEAFTDARKLVLKDRGWTTSHPEITSEEFIAAWRQRTKHVLVDSELRRRKLAKVAMREEGREREKQESEIEERKRKREQQQKWEETRDERINNWRSYTKSTQKRKKAKVSVLG